MVNKQNTEVGTKRSWCVFPQFSLFWHCLSGLFVLCLIINGMIYLGGYKANHIIHITSGIHRKIPMAISNVNETSSLAPNTRTASSNVKQENVVNPHDYSYLLNEPKACNKNTVLVMVVITSITNFGEREAVRKTWGSGGKNPNSNVTVVYLVGSGASPQMQDRLQNESQIYRDIVQEAFIDSYRNLSIKSQAMLRWVNNFCLSSKFVLKTDDDMYVNVPKLLNSLHSQKDGKFILGVIFEHARPIRSKDSKWHTPMSEFREKEYPRYTSGTAYAISTKAIPDLYTASLMTKPFWLEDVYITGLCAKKAGIRSINDYGFHYSKLPVTGCTHKKSITGHRNTIADIYKIHKELQDPNLKC